MTLDPGLYVVATPIGNLGDITYRAVEILKAADEILCEDTRHTAKLCTAYDIRTPRKPYHEHNAEAVRPHIVERLKTGAVIALVSDAGTPLISDPGLKLVQAARGAGVAVFPAPGPCAAIAALSAAGLATDRFLFVGFLPPKAAARRTVLQSLAATEAVLVFYEAPQRLPETLGDMALVLGPERDAVVARELTKIHETFDGAPLQRLAAAYQDAEVKGEIVILVAPPAEVETAVDLDALLQTALASMPVKDAAEAVAAATGAPRRTVYQRALELKGAHGGAKPPR